jgi:26S proteasome regulatory subunit (ATPase 3-interacting protein)
MPYLILLHLFALVRLRYIIAATSQRLLTSFKHPEDAISPEQLAALDDQIADLKTRTTDLQTLAKTLRSTLTSLNSTLSTADLLSSISSLELEKSEILTRLESLKAGHARKITAEEREKVEQEWKVMRCVAARREAIAKMFWGMVEDGVQDRERCAELREGWGLDE